MGPAGEIDLPPTPSQEAVSDVSVVMSFRVFEHKCSCHDEAPFSPISGQAERVKMHRSLRSLSALARTCMNGLRTRHNQAKNKEERKSRLLTSA